METAPWMSLELKEGLSVCYLTRDGCSEVEQEEAHEVMHELRGVYGCARLRGYDSEVHVAVSGEKVGE